MVRSARARPKGRRSYSAPQDLDATALRLDSTSINVGVWSRAASSHLRYMNLLLSTRVLSMETILGATEL